MRMRKKKNLDKRLESCGEYLISCENSSLNYENAFNEQHFIDFNKIFKNNRPIVLEVGCGKGAFACTYAREHPTTNVIAVERVTNAIITGCESAKAQQLPNIIFMKCCAEYLPSYIKSGSISQIFLNFSCPFPKASYAKHRLTHERFLKIYELLMAPGAVICQKTDSPRFFEFSIESFSQYGFKISNVSLDLHNSDFEGNIITEYEKRFSDMGCPIYRLEARLD
ncbi:MAG: tRNA (guanosine(46)-N7)-methyltransferase TrmB [Clostridiales bacterium]|nr:tRNA (guanosine(46)-N7)-methyltransferase TrmB [Clostridiales bacterium]